MCVVARSDDELGPPSDPPDERVNGVAVHRIEYTLNRCQSPVLTLLAPVATDVDAKLLVERESTQSGRNGRERGDESNDLWGPPKETGEPPKRDNVVANKGPCPRASAVPPHQVQLQIRRAQRRLTRVFKTPVSLIKKGAKVADALKLRREVS